MSTVQNSKKNMTADNVDQHA